MQAHQEGNSVIGSSSEALSPAKTMLPSDPSGYEMRIST